MTKTRTLLRYWLPVCLWMAIIFRASGDGGSFAHSSRIIAPIVRFFYPRVSDAALHGIILGVRKVAHLTEYAILAALLWRALRRDDWMHLPWDWRTSIWVLLIIALYAASDEFHQSFVPNREASIIDVVIDVIGGSIGLCLAQFGRWRGWRQRMGPPQI